jgi:hypothetical protein
MDRTKICLLLFYLGVQNTMAYLDPGTGSYAIQLLLAGFLGATLTLKVGLRMLWDKFVTKIKPSA